MALITRLSRLLKADMHAVLDRIEEPQQLLLQAIREMEEALHQEVQHQKLLQHEQRALQRRLQGVAQQQAQGEEELDICFQSGKEGLARNLIKRRLEGERLARVLAQQEEALGEQAKQLSSRIEQHRTELEGMRQKAELLACEQATGSGGRGADEFMVTVSEDEVEVAFLRERARRAQS